MEKKAALFAIPIVFALVLGAYSLGLTHGASVDQSDTFRYGSRVRVYANGVKIGDSHNSLSPGGKNLIMHALATGDNNPPINITVGTVSGGVWTKASANGFSGTDGTVTKNTNDVNGNWSVYHTFTATGTQTLNSTRLYGSTNGTYFAMNNFTATTLQANDQLTINWTIYVS